VVLKRAPPQSHCKIQAPFSATPCEQFEVLSALVQCASFYCERSCPEQRPRAALKPQEPHSSGPWIPGAAPVEVLACREPRGRGRGVLASCKSCLCRIEVSWRCPVASSAVPSVGSVITQWPFSASLWLWQRPTHKQPSESGQR
jgi:hypothetical protein